MTKHIQRKFASGERIEANDEASAAQMQEPTVEQTTWEVRRERQIAEPKPKRQSHREQNLDHQQWQREWGGENPAHLYFATAAADLLAKRLGPQLGRLLALADKTDVNMIFDLLREAEVAAEVASTAASTVAGIEDEPPLPIMH